MPEVGDVLAEKYELVNLLGEGGMGAVYGAKHKRIGKRLAVKMLRPEFAENTEVVNRFAREAEAAAAIGHPAIIDIHDIGTADDGSIFLVMEYLEGESLGEVLDRQGSVQPEYAAYVLCQVLSALDAAHSKGIVHRDLKPDNIFLVDAGQAFPNVKLLDFGISKVVDATDPDARLTQTGTVMGTPYYMAPEQARGRKDLDHRIDNYAMGVILYEAVTGQRPFSGENTLALLHEVQNSYPTPPTELKPDLAPELELIIQCAMAREREQRYQTAAQMLEALLPFVSEHAAGQLTLGRLNAGATSGAPAMPDTSGATWPASQPSLGESQTELSGSRPELSGSHPGAVAPPSGTGMAWQSGAEKPKRTGLIVGMLVLALLLVGGGVAAALALGGGDTDVPATPPQVVSTTPTPDPPAAPDAATDASETAATSAPESDDVTVTLLGLPDGAQVRVDGTPVEGTEIRRPRSDAPREISVELDGHQPWSQRISFERDLAVAITLLPAPADGSPTKAASTTGRSGRSDRSSTSGQGGRSQRTKVRFASDFE